jgi:hypothetical protein
MWCPAGVLPGGTGCSGNFLTISALVNNMRNNASNYDEPGVIYFTANPGSQSLTLTDAGTSLGGSYDTLKNYNLTLQGGWNGDTVSPSFSGQTDFGTHPITIGTDGSLPGGNPWVGNLTLNDFLFSSGSQTAVTIYTTTGSIALNNVDVNNQGNGKNTALLNSTSGDITVTNGTFDGNNSNSAGFAATTGSGSITISDSAFTENRKSGATNNNNGAALSAPVVTLTNVTAARNDGNGVVINNANLITLNNVMASNNGTAISPAGLINNVGSGVFVNGNAGSLLLIQGGTFNNNQRYGIELSNLANTTVYIQSALDSCAGNIGGCSNATFVVDATAPTLTLPVDITTPATDPTGAVVNFSASATDNVDPSVAVICSPASGSTFAVGITTVNCVATDSTGNTTSGSFHVTVVGTNATPTITTSNSGPSAAPASESSSQPGSSLLIIPLTGVEMINLSCDSSFWAFGIKLSFFNLCEQQALFNNLDADHLPGQLPNGATFVMGLDLSVYSENQLVKDLADGTGVQMDFPILGNVKDQFAVLHWSGSEWVEVSQEINASEVSEMLNGNNHGLYQIQSPTDEFYQIFTTEETGIFVLVQK